MKTKLILFGITGDLSTRKLIPALSNIISTGEFNDLTVIGVSRRQPDKFQLLGEHHQLLSNTTSIFSMDLTKETEYTRLKEYIDLQDDEQGIIFLSVPPESTAQIVELLGKSGLNSPNIKLMLEKPFGVDLGSAQKMVTETAEYFDESQIYRVDHYLAKEMSQNIIAMREGNALFEHIWDNRSIEKIELVAYEQIGIEGRADFYEQTGALRDVLQGHLMQLLSLVLMDIPTEFEWDSEPVQRSRAFEKLELADPARSLRGQYKSYREEVKNEASVVETFVRVELASSDPRWQGVPLILATGKGLNSKTTEVRLHFRKTRDQQTNSMVFHIQPNEGVAVEIFAKRPGYDREFTTSTLGFTYGAGTRIPDAYEQVLVDAIKGQEMLFATSDEILRAWEILQPVQDAWKEGSDDLVFYYNGADPSTIA
jgi:glucose-6-phosphate 1-dehydrogenase